MPTTLPRSEHPERPAKRRKVLIVDDNRFFGACLQSVLEHESDLAVCGIAIDSIGLDKRVRRLQPDVLVIDLSLGAESGVETARRLRRLNITTPILFVSTLVGPSTQQVADIGCCRFIPKSREPAEFLVALRKILELPASVQPNATVPVAAAAPADRPTAAKRTLPKRFLIVEDGTAVMEFIAEVLRAEGREVHAAETIADARKLLASGVDVGSFCPIIDVVLQFESGVELAEELLKQHPALRVLFISGYTDDVVLVQRELAGRTAFLGKPFTKGALLAALERLHA